MPTFKQRKRNNSQKISKNLSSVRFFFKSSDLETGFFILFQLLISDVSGFRPPTGVTVKSGCLFLGLFVDTYTGIAGSLNQMGHTVIEVEVDPENNVEIEK